MAISDCDAQVHTNPLGAIRGMRSVVAHEYGEIDADTVWETAKTARSHSLLVFVGLYHLLIPQTSLVFIHTDIACAGPYFNKSL